MTVKANISSAKRKPEENSGLNGFGIHEICNTGEVGAINDAIYEPVIL